MSQTRTIIWTPVAAGLRPDGILQVTLVATPQLTTTATTTLAAFPDFAGANWCTLISGGSDPAMTFLAVIETRSGGAASRVEAPAKRVSADPDPKIFSTMFPDSTKVSTYLADNYANSRIRSIDMGGLDDALNRLQEQVFVASRAVVPPTSGLVGAGKPLSGYAIDPATYEQTARAINESLAAQKFTNVPDTRTASGITEAIVQMRQFVEPLDTEANVPDMFDPGYRVPWPEWEFHEKFSVLDSHPLLLRAMGFVIDLEIDPADVINSATRAPASIPSGAIDMWMNPQYTAGPDAVDIPQGAAVTYRPGAAFAPTFTGGANSGFVQIDGDGQRWPIITSEVGSEAAATAAIATGYERAVTERLGDEERAPFTMPARSTTGIALVRPAMAERTHGELDRQRNIATSINLSARSIQIADAEDIVVGFRMDVRPAGALGWLSLNWRNGLWRPDPDTYGAGTVDLGVDEGWTEPAGTSATGSSGGEYRYMPVVSMWSGWSQSIERPGKAIDEASEANAINPLSAPPPGFGATIDYVSPPGGAKLPILRFGTAYDLRLRVVYLGGVSEQLGALEASNERRNITYRRHEPVLSPTVYLGDEDYVPLTGFLPAEPMRVTGLASNAAFAWMQSPEMVVIRSLGNGAAVDPRQISTRWLTPARVSPWLVEQHGLLDSGGRPDPAKYSQIAARDKAYYGPTTPGYAASGDIISFTWSSPAEGVTPYYPDPLTAGVLLRGVPTSSGTPTEASANFGGAWPSLEPVHLTVGGTGSPGATVTGQVVDLQVPAGRTQILRSSSSIPSGDLDLLDLWDRVKSTASATDAAKGAFWQLSPYGRITVIHATKQPVSAPYFGSGDTWSGERENGEIQCRVSGTMHIDEPSTESVSLTGTIVSGVDGGPGAPSPRITRDAVGDIGSLNVANPAPGGPTGSTAYDMVATVQLQDTRRYDLDLVGTAYSRYAEYFRQLTATTHTAGSTTPIAVVPTSAGAAQPIVSGSARVQWQQAGESVSGTLNVDYTEQAEAGTITPIAAGSVPTGAIVVSGIPTPIALSSTDSATGDTTHTFTLPASARPQPLDVAGTVPAFTWNAAPRATTARSVTSTRSSASLRVYLERPWFTSGLNEDLAVLVRPRTGGSAVSDYVSRWGGDPTVTGGGSLPAVWPKAAQFLNRASAQEGVRLAEDTSLKVAIARFTVGQAAADGSLIGWDPDSDQWYVDLDIDIAAAYRPFIRLALARFQPGAPRELQLSPMTLLDVVQLDPGRTATVALRKISGKYRADVTLTGPSYKANDVGSGPGRTFLVHERLSDDDSPGADAVLWEEVSRTDISGRYSSGQGTWTGRIDLGSSVGGGRHRLVIEQYERWRTDGGVGPGGTTGLRLVHQDVIALG